MKSCNHNQWLSVCKQGYDTALLESNRLRVLLDKVADPDEVEPTFNLFIGGRTKSIALEKVFGIKRRRIFKSKQFAGDINLHLAAESELSSQPVLVADGSLNSSGFRYHSSDHICHETKRWRLKDCESYCPEKLEQAVFSRLLAPFTDVVCFFASDLGGFPAVAQHLAGWIHGNTIGLPLSAVKPTVIIVTDKMPPTVQREREARKAFLWLLNEHHVNDPFDIMSNLEIVAIHPPRTFGPSPNWNRLKNRLLRASNDARKHRTKTRTLYSMTHFVAFTEAACGHFSESITEPFNFVQASRVQNPVASDLKKHLANLIRLCTTPQELVGFAVPIIASSFLLDSYPPDCHCKSSTRGMLDEADFRQCLIRNMFSQ